MSLCDITFTFSWFDFACSTFSVVIASLLIKEKLHKTPESFFFTIIKRGLRPEFEDYNIQSEAKTLDDIKRAAITTVAFEPLKCHHLRFVKISLPSITELIEGYFVL
jgi:hypothetical protein